MRYCKRDIPEALTWYVNQFSFLHDAELEKRLGRAYYTARYISKLMEALHAEDDEVHAFVKFQIMQYASIYEAVISKVLWTVFKDHSEVRQLQTHMAYKPVSACGSLMRMLYGEEEIITCVYRKSTTPRNAISFSDKVDCAVRLDFLDSAYSGEIKNIYHLRNLAHIESEAKQSFEVEIEHSRLGYLRLMPFLDRIRLVLRDAATNALLDIGPTNSE